MDKDAPNNGIIRLNPSQLNANLPNQIGLQE